MNREHALKILRNPRAGKAELRACLAEALGVEVPTEQVREAPTSLFATCKELFMKAYQADTGMQYAYSGADAKALKELVAKITTLAGDGGDAGATFKAMLHYLPEWYKQNAYSLPVINKKFNEITASIKRNGNHQHNSLKNSYLAEFYS